MEGIQFDEPTYGTPYRPPQNRGLVNWLLKKGIAKDKQQAQYILVGVAVVAIVVGLFAFSSGNTNTIQPGVNPATGEILPGETNYDFR